MSSCLVVWCVAVILMDLIKRFKKKLKFSVFGYFKIAIFNFIHNFFKSSCLVLCFFCCHFMDLVNRLKKATILSLD